MNGDPEADEDVNDGQVLTSTRFDRDRLTATRQAVRAYAERYGLADDRLRDFLIAVGECTANVVEHGGGHGRLRLSRRGDRLVCEISDTGTGIPAAALARPHLPAPSRPRGRGIWLMRHLTDEADFVTGAGGTTVRLTMRLPS